MHSNYIGTILLSFKLLALIGQEMLFLDRGPSSYKVTFGDALDRSYLKFKIYYPTQVRNLLVAFLKDRW